MPKHSDDFLPALTIPRDGSIMILYLLELFVNYGKEAVGWRADARRHAASHCPLNRALDVTDDSPGAVPAAVDVRANGKPAAYRLMAPLLMPRMPRERAAHCLNGLDHQGDDVA